MTKSSNTLLFSIALAAVLVLFGVNALVHYYPSDAEPPPAGTLALVPADIKGMSIESQGRVFTLNQKQQADALSFINRMRPVDKKDYPNRSKFDFSRLIIYLFDKPEVSLVPITFSEQNLVFDIPSLNSSSYYLEMSGGEFYSLILKATQS